MPNICSVLELVRISLSFISVAEQAESIDNPLHEAAKRGKRDLHNTIE